VEGGQSREKCREAGEEEAEAGFAVGEIEAGELAVVFSCGFVIGESGFDFGGEVAKLFLATIEEDISPPAFRAFFVCLIKRYAFVAGRAAAFSFFSVAAIFGAGCRAEVGPAVIEGVMILVVNLNIGRSVKNHSVHKSFLRTFLLRSPNPASGISAVSVVLNVPVELTQILVILPVNEGEHKFGKGDEADVVAEAKAAIEQIYEVSDFVRQAECS
jgi:hypothetical protein